MTKRERRLVDIKQKRDRFYLKRHIAIPEDVTSMQSAVSRAVAKRGHKPYRKDRKRCERFLDRLFEKYRLKGTTDESFWKLSAICALIGPSPEILRRAKSYSKPSKKSNSKVEKRKHGKR